MRVESTGHKLDSANIVKFLRVRQENLTFLSWHKFRNPQVSLPDPVFDAFFLAMKPESFHMFHGRHSWSRGNGEA
jgi:hypothetical protein